MNGTEFFTCTLCIFFHSAFSDDNAYTCELYEFILKFFHTHACCRTNRYHLEFIIFKRSDNRTRMENRIISYIYRKFSSLFNKSSVGNVTACCHASVKINNISDFNIFQILCRNRCYKYLFSVSDFYHYKVTSECVVIV